MTAAEIGCRDCLSQAHRPVGVAVLMPRAGVVRVRTGPGIALQT